MADDIVTQLREHSSPMCGACDTWGCGKSCECSCHLNICQEAADEIERLQAEVKDLRNTHRAICALTWEIARQNPSHLKAWIDVRMMVVDDEEALRG